MTDVPLRRRRAAEVTPTEEIIAVLLELERQKAENAISKRLWLVGTIAAGILAGNNHSTRMAAKLSVALANEILEEMEKTE
jgi:hypothetical protein